MSRDEHIERLTRQLAHAQSAAARAAAPPVSTNCPMCDDPLAPTEVGCARCGHGMPSWRARHRVALAWVAFLLLTAIGFGALLSGGATATGPGGMLLNAALLVLGAGLVGYGSNAIAAPTSLTLVDVETDAFGLQHGRNARGATAAQGTLIGAVCIVLGLGLLAFGIVAGLVI